MDASNASMSNYTKGWYNAVTTGLSLDSSKFQLVQGALPLGNTSESLYRMCDCVPPLAINNNYNNSWSKFSNNYQSLLYALNSGNGSDKLQQLLGDSYADWRIFLKKDASTDSVDQIFEKWADRNLDPSVAQSAKNQFDKQSLNPITEAIKNLKKAKNDNKIEFTTTISDIKNRIRSGKSADINLDSSSMNYKKTDTYGHGFISAPEWFFNFSVKTDVYAQSINEKMNKSKLKITAKINNYISIDIKPKEWFVSSVVAKGYDAPNNNYVWDPNDTDNWDSFFGDKGMLKRFISDLIIVDGMTVTISSDVSFTEEEYKYIHADTKLSYWPFFETLASVTSKSNSFKDSTGGFKTTIVNNPGNPKILGVNVMNIKTMLS